MVKKYIISKVKTTSGLLAPLWKDYDPIPKIKPRYIYYTTCAAGATKGPYLHEKRRGLLALIEGKAVFIYKTQRSFSKLYLDASKEVAMLDIPKKTAYLIKNPYKKESKFINICDYPWKKNDNETKTPNWQPS